MATPATLLSQIATAVEAEVSGIVRLGSDHRDDLEKIPAGATRYQLRGGPAGIRYDSNQGATIEAVELVIAHRLASPTAERTYTEGALQTTLEALIAPAWWRALAACREVARVPGYAVERRGNVIEAVVTTELVITP